ncbi:hypothetical protein GOBAR_AA10933 [Gossypium barbadense]|uniref:Uncharacterized protein n=4 Tax=Gossypium TaxID=3633 RepID=A0A2P5Y2A6_GOSBA|nr:hypothetical protein GOBAR_AA10933 [Gossypium barbadense]
MGGKELVHASGASFFPSRSWNVETRSATCEAIVHDHEGLVLAGFTCSIAEAFGTSLAEAVALACAVQKAFEKKKKEYPRVELDLQEPTALPYDHIHRKTVRFAKTPRKPKTLQPQNTKTLQYLPPKMSAARSVLRSAATRATAAARLAGATKSMPRPACSPFRISKQNPFPARIFRSPVEMSCCVETLLPYHTATASALLTSMLSVSRRRSNWTAEGQNQTR